MNRFISQILISVILINLISIVYGNYHQESDAISDQSYGDFNDYDGNLYEELRGDIMQELRDLRKGHRRHNRKETAYSPRKQRQRQRNQGQGHRQGHRGGYPALISQADKDIDNNYYRGYSEDYDGFSSRFVRYDLDTNENEDVVQKVKAPKKKPKKKEVPLQIQQIGKAAGASTTLTLYHSTSKKAAQSIIKSKTMLAGKKGAFVGGIYFASDPASARLKGILPHMDEAGMGAMKVPKGVLKYGEYVIVAEVTAKWLLIFGEGKAKGMLEPDISDELDIQYMFENEQVNPDQSTLTDAVKKHGKVIYKGKTYTAPFKTFPAAIKAQGKTGLAVESMGYESYGSALYLNSWLTPGKGFDNKYAPITDTVNEKFEGTIQARRDLTLGPEYVVYDSSQVKVVGYIPLGSSEVQKV